MKKPVPRRAEVSLSRWAEFSHHHAEGLGYSRRMLLAALAEGEQVATGF